MELHPILDQWPPTSSPLATRLWYVISSTEPNATNNAHRAANAGQGDHETVAEDSILNGAAFVTSSPSARVGATASFDAAEGVVRVIGGADPSGAHADLFELRLKADFRWRKVETQGFKARYEHAAFTPASHPSSVFVFGGADANGNTNSLQVYDAASHSWSTPSVSGAAPSPRTYHVSGTAAKEDRFFVFSGGEAGSQPVGDRQLHCFDASKMKWSSMPAKGTPPKPRHGHTLTLLQDRLVLFGGMAGHAFYNDLCLYDLATGEWKTVKTRKQDWPCGRAAHGAVALDQGRMALFGGMCGQGALADLWILSCDDWKWTRIEVEGPPPASRLDFAMTLVRPSEIINSAAAADTGAKTTNELDINPAATADTGPKTINTSPVTGHETAAPLVPAQQTPTDDSEAKSPSAAAAAKTPSAGAAAKTPSATADDETEALPPLASAGNLATIVAAEGEANFALVTEEEGEGLERRKATTKERCTVVKNKQESRLHCGEAEGRAEGGVDTLSDQFTDALQVKDSENPPPPPPDLNGTSSDIPNTSPPATSAPTPSTITSSSSSSSSLSSSSCSAILIFGGMDTEGEIFDDCLLILL